jgi:hypothetical protein
MRTPQCSRKEDTNPVTPGGAAWRAGGADVGAAVGRCGHPKGAGRAAGHTAALQLHVQAVGAVGGTGAVAPAAALGVASVARGTATGGAVRRQRCRGCGRCGGQRRRGVGHRRALGEAAPLELHVLAPNASPVPAAGLGAPTVFTALPVAAMAPAVYPVVAHPARGQAEPAFPVEPCCAHHALVGPGGRALGTRRVAPSAHRPAATAAAAAAVRRRDGGEGGRRAPRETGVAKGGVPAAGPRALGLRRPRTRDALRVARPARGLGRDPSRSRGEPVTSGARVAAGGARGHAPRPALAGVDQLQRRAGRAAVAAVVAGAPAAGAGVTPIVTPSAHEDGRRRRPAPRRAGHDLERKVAGAAAIRTSAIVNHVLAAGGVTVKGRAAGAAAQALGVALFAHARAADFVRTGRALGDAHVSKLLVPARTVARVDPGPGKGAGGARTLGVARGARACRAAIGGGAHKMVPGAAAHAVALIPEAPASAARRHRRPAADAAGGGDGTLCVTERARVRGGGRRRRTVSAWVGCAVVCAVVWAGVRAPVHHRVKAHRAGDAASAHVLAVALPRACARRLCAHVPLVGIALALQAHRTVGRPVSCGVGLAERACATRQRMQRGNVPSMTTRDKRGRTCRTSSVQWTMDNERTVCNRQTNVRNVPITRVRRRKVHASSRRQAATSNEQQVESSK